MAEATTNQGFGSRAAAAMVALGILLSRLTGLIRNHVLAHYLGASDAADAFNAALRIPNFLQNLFGEGVLSASFIPVYARLRAENRNEEASQLAEALFALLALTTSVLVVAGIFATPWMIDAIAPGFNGATRELTIQLVRILFPGAGLLVLSAWCLGILNSHRRFLLSYTAPVLWNFAIIVALYWRGAHLDRYALAPFVAWASVVGSALQFGIQLPTVFRFLWPMSLRLHVGEHVRTVVRNFGPVFISRGVVQISAYIDTWLASFLPMGSVSFLLYGQMIYMLPVSLFGMSVSAAELPTMSSATGSEEEISRTLRERLSRGLEQISFFVVPSTIGFLFLGNVIVAAIYRSGIFGEAQVYFTWSVIAGSAVGLLASTSGRLYSSTFYALRDTRTPLKFAVVRVILTLGLGYFFALPLPRYLGLEPWGVAGLTLSAGIAGWVEFTLLRSSLQKRIGRVSFSIQRVLKLYAAALIAAFVAVMFYRFALRPIPVLARPIPRGVLELACYGSLYLLITQWLGLSTMSTALRALRRR